MCRFVEIFTGQELPIKEHPSLDAQPSTTSRYKITVVISRKMMNLNRKSGMVYFNWLPVGNYKVLISEYITGRKTENHGVNIDVQLFMIPNKYILEHYMAQILRSETTPVYNQKFIISRK